MPISPKCMQMSTGTNGHLGQIGSRGKGVPQVPYAHFPQIITNGHWGKWALKANGHLGERSTQSALCLFSPNVYQWALGQMSTLEKWTFRRKRYPMCPVPISPKCMQMARGANAHFGERGTPSALKRYPQVP